jgi:periplasmic copper chaperone A
MKTMSLLKKIGLPLLSAIFIASILISACSKQDSIEIKNQWVRASNDGQDVSAAYMTIVSNEDTSLIAIDSDVADVIEIHSMSMENGVMKMRMLDTLDLIAGKPTELSPGGFHLMLFDLKKPLTAGKEAHFTLHFKNKAGQEKTISVTSPIKAEAP